VYATGKLLLNFAMKDGLMFLSTMMITLKVWAW
jgi:hypothetical protein